ncbi:MAG: N-acetyltransferase [Oscillatoria sp. SIO1A7]|nr:N-acetyltransferase [Oscillatoria sp. SIO1A7]
MLVREYTKDDLQAIADIYNESIVRGGITMDTKLYSAEDMRSQVKKFSDRETILVGELDGAVIGWGIIKRYSDRPGYRVCCETSIYLSFAQTGKGYGKLLQRSLLQKVIEFHYHHIVAKIFACNQKSIDFHKQFGFEIVGLQKEIGFTKGSWYDMVIMQLILADVPPYQADLA